MSKALESELTNYFKGRKHKLATDVENGDTTIKTAKDPLMFDLYTFLYNHMLVHSSKEMPFAHAYMVIAWNRMCCSANAFGIRHSHMEWRGDALTTKAEIDGAHIYINPLQSSICPIAALGFSWETSDFDRSDLLFPGSNPYERFRQYWLTLLCENDVEAELRRQGLGAEELGAHLMRKGSSMFCSSGFTACLSSTAVHLRAERSLVGVPTTYLRHKAAGYMHVGRTVSGLPTEIYKFSTLAPHFEFRDECVESGLKLTFPALPEKLEYIAEYCLASLVHHAAFFRHSLSPKHHIFETPLLLDENLLAQLSTRVRTRDGCTETRIRPTRISPHVKDGLVDALSKIEAIRTDTVKDIITELEKRAIGVGAVRYDGMHAVVRACLKDAAVPGLVEKLIASQTAEVQVDRGDNQFTPCHYWGGKFRQMQSNFAIRDCSLMRMWGNKSKQIPLLRQRDGRDMPSRKLQKRLNQLRYVMSKV
ncbi:hypothetical protein PHMEG_00023104 [Phytophthora megakarya]|uniref:Ndc10 domain-containing protein n=1 Tax=Phytophthora megakarya TaxID=4795 RepID=A0A225VK55_9STRA|nr:hypothetical protein PHMEG_00023104 [Phytophthora megakarya]